MNFKQFVVKKILKCEDFMVVRGWRLKVYKFLYPEMKAYFRQRTK